MRIVQQISEVGLSAAPDALDQCFAGRVQAFQHGSGGALHERVAELRIFLASLAQAGAMEENGFRWFNAAGQEPIAPPDLTGTCPCWRAQIR
jgi:hypothetical protein